MRFSLMLLIFFFLYTSDIQSLLEELKKVKEQIDVYVDDGEIKKAEEQIDISSKEEEPEELKEQIYVYPANTNQKKMELKNGQTFFIGGKTRKKVGRLYFNFLFTN